MNAKERHVLLVALSLLLAIAIAGCGGATQPATEVAPATQAPVEAPTSAPVPAEITLRYQSFTADVMANEKALLAEYEATHPGIKIAIEPCPAMECYDKIVMSTQAGNPPDVFMGWWTFDVASTGVALNLDPYIQKAGGQAFIDQYVPAAFGMGIKDGSVYSLPFRTGASVMYINLNLLEKAGLEFPKEALTWEKFREYAIAMTDPASGQYGFAISGAPTDTGVEWEFWSFLVENGGEYLKDNRAAFNSQAGVGALQFLVDLIFKDKAVHPGIAETDVNMALDLLAADKVGMWVEGPWYTTDLQTKYPGSRVAVTYSPVGVHDGNPAGGTSLILSAATKYPQEAFDFISWMTAKEQVSRWAAGAAFLPAAVGSATDQAFQTPDMQVSINSTMLPNTRTANLYPENNALNTMLRSQLVAAYLGDKSPKEALDQAASEWNEVLKKYYP